MHLKCECPSSTTTTSTLYHAPHQHTLAQASNSLNGGLYEI